ncbi:hypothetical protein ACHMW6_02330 [Pseudoduganella sp. UC29_106]|uniref:hypothetical protein n=1 Tax=Pseudoduganella sp. UC29_106 TaxID=3374553 RepID=UPI003756663B
MNHVVLKVLALTVLAGVSTVAAAQDQATVQVPASAQPSYRLAPQEFYNYEQRYLLDNGLALQMSQKRHRYYTSLRNQQPVEVYPIAPGVFVSSLGTRLEFRDEGDMIVITHLDRLPYAGTLNIDKDRVFVVTR